MGLTRKHEKPQRRKLTERLFRRIVFKYYSRNLLLDLQLEAKRESIAYIKQNMMHCRIFESRRDLLRFALEAATAAGLNLEFGVHKGASIREIAALTRCDVHGFDSFEGLPEDWSGNPGSRGSFDLKGRAPKVPANVNLHAGWFDRTLPGFLEKHAEPVSFAHIDCDLYSSTKTVLALLGGRLQIGSVLVFDEYFNYPNWQAHEFKAFQELVQQRGLSYEYLGFAANGTTVILRITDLGPDLVVRPGGNRPSP